MSVLLAHEKQHGQNNAAANAVRGLTSNDDSSDSSDDGEIENASIRKNYQFDDFEMKSKFYSIAANIDVMDSDSDDNAPTVMVGKKLYPIDEITDSLIAEMTPQEKDTYIQIYQEHFSHLY